MVSFTANVNSSACLVTSTSIVFATPSRVTVTGTTFLPSFSVIFPYSTVSVSFSASPFAVTFSFTFAWSSAVKLSPATGDFEISAGFVASFTANVNSSACLMTSTSIVFATPSRVTVTETTVLSCSCVTLPNSTLSPSFNDSPLTSKFSLTFSLSSSFKSSPIVGVFGISIGFVESFTPTVNTWSFLTTGTSTVFVIPSRVTFTGTTFLPSFSLIGSYSTA